MNSKDLNIKITSSPWVIQITKDGKELNRVPIENEQSFIGRMSQNHIVLDDPAVSRAHAMISMVDDKFFIVDQGSQNGTLINGKEICREELKSGDLITIGPFHLKLVPKA